MTSRWAFLRLLGLVYLVAFLSFRTQVDGLIGSGGILPVAGFLAAARAQLGEAAPRVLPTLCWLNSSDAFLHLLCAAGTVAGVLTMLGVAQALSLAIAWVCYLSLQVAGQDFMGFQWDILLLEAGAIGILWAPLSWRSRAMPPSGWSARIGRWLVLWLLFRLMLGSGLCKLQSGDPTWRTMSALDVHFETQPLPTWIGWYAHQLPVWILHLACKIMFAIELGTPWLILVPVAPVRLAAFTLITLLMAGIALTGNYCFFNLLTVTLALPLLHEDAWPRWIRRLASPEGKAARDWPIPFAAAAGLCLFIASAVSFGGQMRLPIPWPRPCVSIYQTVAGLRAVSCYGLFAMMTTERQEITVQGSEDGKHWEDYGFRWKPGIPTRRPGFIEPFQPRLDWQIWFAALGSARDNPWFISFCQSLLEGRPAVLALLDKNPFPDVPPRLLRATIGRYRFTDFATRRSTGAWWRLEPPRPYIPVLSLTSTSHQTI